MEIIITSPSLNPKQNVSGISSVTQFIIQNNKIINYIHFELGKKDNERGGVYRIGAILKCMFLWWKTLSKYPQAIIHYNFPLSKASILRDPLFIGIARIRKRKMVIHLHGGNFLTAPHIPFYLNALLKKVFALPVPFIVLSELEKKLVQERFDCADINVLPNCIDLKDAEDFEREPNTHNTLTIGYLGRIAETKGMDYLLDACIQMGKKGILFLLKIAGKEEVKDKYIPTFQKELGDHFIYEGVVFGEAKNKFLKSLDVFVLPSFFEGLPISLIECMSFGVVPITTPVGSIKEIINDGNNGLFINIKDSQSIIKQFDRLERDRMLLSKLSVHSKEYIIRTFNSKIYIDKLNKIYAKTCNLQC